MNADTVLRHAGEATFQEVGGETILCHLDTGSYFTLNRVGAEYWRLIDGQGTIGQHADRLATRYQVTLARVTADLLALSQTLVSQGLAVIVPADLDS